MAQQVRALVAGATPQGLAITLLGMADRPDAAPRLTRIEVPTLVITGADDTLIPPSESAVLTKGGRPHRVIRNRKIILTFYVVEISYIFPRHTASKIF
jgi:pimeloyl-ACP methyl ester carboxylesterase